ncbi:MULTISPECIES: NIPSNAP family protein [unclassified Methylobacterium]|jgi:NIPSNAP|uniref:NIPSNAP family protein n=1 Tax=unclassified Methylobacterium TaxID=2615210 RepID=UPI00135291DA|nr:NIPSNAP family protein [Methylobacterium sp. 2A]MWV24498.1 NIPSNAP family protein [Methylobacterium sp. 2A]
MLYELATLSCPLLEVGRAAEGVYGWVNDAQAKGELFGCWRTEIGTLGRLIVLRGFEAPEDMTAERRRALLSVNPFNAGSVVTALEMDSYAPFPFLPPIRTGDRGGVYEFRTYRLKPGGLPPTLTGWESAITSAAAYTEHLVANLYALDGAPRITHIWAFTSLEERAELRAQAYGAGVWPPKGGPEQIADATSTIAIPQGRSSLT